MKALFIACLFMFLAPSTGTVMLDGGERYDIDKKIEVLEDRDGNLTLNSVLAEQANRQFRPVDGDSLDAGFTGSAYWARFSVYNPSSIEKTCFLEVAYPLVDEIDLYVIDEFRGSRSWSSGDTLPFGSREIGERNFFFPIAVPGRSKQTCYLRFKSDNALSFQLLLWSQSGLVAHVSRENIFLGVYYGIMLSMMLFLCFMYFSLRDRTLLYYLFFVFSYTLFMFVFNGLAFRYLWPGSAWWGNHSLPFMMSLAGLSGFILLRAIYATRNLYPVFDRLLIASIAVCVIGMLLSLAGPVWLSVRIVTAISIYAIGVIVTACLFSLRQDRNKKLFLMVWPGFVIGVLMYAAKTTGVAGSGFLLNWGGQIGFGIGVMLISVPLTDRVTELLKEKKRLYEMTRLDDLTKVYNYRYFEQALSHELRRAERYKRPVSLIMGDIDHFKKFNDSFGHRAGDEILKHVAKTLKDKTRDVDIVARYGGEEFAIILPETEAANAAEKANQLKKIIAALIVDFEGRRLAVTMSFGVSSYPAHADNYGQLVEVADKALFISKKKGRNRVTLGDIYQ